MTKRTLFLAAVFVSLTIPVLANEAGFRDRGLICPRSTGGAVAVVPTVPSAVLFNGALTSTHARTSPGNGQSVFGSLVDDSFDGSSQRSFSSIVQIDDGVISISVPEPGTMGTLAMGLAMIPAWLIRGKRSNSKSFLH